KIDWAKGEDNCWADLLSRRYEDEPEMDDRMVYRVAYDAPEFPTREDIVRAQEQAGRPIGKGYITRDGLTYYQNGIWVPEGLRHTIISLCHSLPPLSH